MFPQLIANALIAGSIYGLVALGFGLIYSTTRFFHFSHGAVYTSGAYFAYLFITVCSLPLAASVILSVALTAVIGVLIEIGIYRRLRLRKASSTVQLLCSLGVLIVIQNLLSLIFGDSTKSIAFDRAGNGMAILGARVTFIQVLMIAVSFCLCCLTWAIVHRTRTGRMLRAIANDVELSVVVGIDTDKLTVFVYALGSALAAAAAILASFDTDMTPTIGFNALLMGVVASIVGGVGSIWGSLAGGFLVGFAANLGVWKLPTQWQEVLVFAILLLFLLIRPQGFFGKPLRKATI